MPLEPRIRVSALLRWEGRILLCRHEKAGRGEYWLLPGGGVNGGESLVEALRRELEEEVGVGDDLHVRGADRRRRLDRAEAAFVGKHVVHIIFAADLSGRSLEKRHLDRRSPSAAIASSTPADLDDVVLHPPLQRFLRPLAAGRPGRLSRSALGAVSMAPLLRRVSIQGYRAARALELVPGSVCALVGEASSGKSTVLTAIWTLLEAAAPPPTIDDVARDGAEGGRIHLEADVAKGTIFLDARPPDTLNLNRAGAPPVLFLPANLRKRTLAAPATGRRRSRGRRAPHAADSSITTGPRRTAASRSWRAWSACSPRTSATSCS